MISFEDCIALCGLTAEEIAAIAEHEHIPEIAAANLGRYLLAHPHGADDIKTMLVDDIRLSAQKGDFGHAAQLTGALRHFLASHPAAPASQGPLAAKPR